MTGPLEGALIFGLLYEYACHEANYGMVGVLAGARFLEKEQSICGLAQL